MLTARRIHFASSARPTPAEGSAQATRCVILERIRGQPGGQTGLQEPLTLGVGRLCSSHEGRRAACHNHIDVRAIRWRRQMKFIKCLYPTLSADYVACVRAYALDITSSLLLFCCTNVMTGRVWRFPFDDEIYTLSRIEGNSAVKVIVDAVSGDVHPPLSYLLFLGLHHLGLSESMMRLCSLAMIALTLMLFHLLALTLIVQRSRDAATLPTRLIAVLLFGLCPLAVSRGDALRWYPLFAMLISLFVTLYLVGGNSAARLWSAVPLGIAASTNFLAAIVIPPFALYRYGFQRQFCARFDVAYWLVVLLFASFGIVWAYWLFVHNFHVVGTQLNNDIIRAAMTDTLGFFGGDALGISQAWIIVPTIAISAISAFSEADRRQLANPIHLILLMLAAPVLMVLLGFARPRSFLYLAPPLATVLTLFLDRQARDRNADIAVLLVSLILVSSIGAIANINNGTHPFKRNSIIPYQSILDFVQNNKKGSVLVISTDPTIPWVLRHQHTGDDRCASYFFNADDCLATERRYDSIFVIVGHNYRSEDATFMREFNSVLGEVTGGRQKVATIHAGIDEDAQLKSWLTGVPLGKFILTIDLYQ
jgi:hypothetical protein